MINNLGRAGAEGVFVRQANFLIQSGHEVFFITLFLDPDDNFSSDLEVEKAKKLCLKANNFLDFKPIKRLLNFVDENQIETIYATLELPKIIARVIKILRPKIRVVIRESSTIANKHGKPEIKDWKFKIIDMILNFWVDQIVVLSSEMKMLVSRYQPWHKKKILIIGNGIVIRDSLEEIKKSNEQKKKNIEIIILAAASMNYYERAFEYIIEAVHILSTELRKNVKLVFAGDGTLRPMYEEFTHKLNLVDQITFLGRLDTESLRQQYRQSHVFVMSSTAEGFPNVILEAGSFGLPIITTPVGGATDVVIEGETGFFIPAKNAKAIAEKISFFIDNRDKWYEMGIASYERIKDHFALSSVMIRVVDALKSK